MAIGELSLDGTVRPVPGVLSIALAVRQQGGRGLLVPEANAGEAGIVSRVPVCPVGSLAEIARALRGLTPMRRPAETGAAAAAAAPSVVDLADVRGQAHVRRALEIAAAGAHNVLTNWPLYWWFCPTRRYGDEGMKLNAPVRMHHNPLDKGMH